MNTSKSSEKSIKVAAGTLFVSGGLALVLGVAWWLGYHGGPVPAHGLVGSIAVIALWVLSYQASRAGLPKRSTRVAIGWGIAAVVFGGVHPFIVPGTYHWAVQAAHLVLSMGMMSTGRQLVAQLLQMPCAVPAVQP